MYYLSLKYNQVRQPLLLLPEKLKEKMPTVKYKVKFFVILIVEELFF